MEKKNRMSNSAALGVGVALGIVFGIAMDNLGFGIAIGIALAVAFGAFRSKKNPPDA